MWLDAALLRVKKKSLEEGERYSEGESKIEMDYMQWEDTDAVASDHKTTSTADEGGGG